MLSKIKSFFKGKLEDEEICSLYSKCFLLRLSVHILIHVDYAIVDGEERLLFKDPITDQGKRSQRGLVYVQKDEEGNIYYKDGLNQAEYDKLNDYLPDLLEVVFENGELKRDEKLSDIRGRLKQQ